MSSLKIGKNFSNTSGTSTVVQIFPPTANVHGAILRTVVLFAAPTSSGTAHAWLFADTAAPATPGDGTKRMIAQCSANTLCNVVNLPNQLEIPAGLGVWVGYNLSAAAEITWDYVDI